MTQTQIDFLDAFLAEPPKSLPDEASRAELEAILLQIGGFFWYKCTVQGDSPPFLHGDRSRSGWVLFVPVFKNAKIVVYIYGFRLAHSQGEDPTIVMDEPRQWNGKGTIAKDSNRFVFVWENKYEQGTNRETILLDLTRRNWPGTFEHVTRDGLTVRGSVSYEPVTAGAHFPKDRNGISWIPENTDPQFRSGLESDQVTAWGKRLYGELADEKKDSEDKPFVLVEIVSRRHLNTDRTHLAESSTELRAEIPSAPVYVTRRGNEPISVMGLGSGL